MEKVFILPLMHCLFLNYVKESALLVGAVDMFEKISSPNVVLECRSSALRIKFIYCGLSLSLGGVLMDTVIAVTKLTVKEQCVSIILIFLHRSEIFKKIIVNYCHYCRPSRNFKAAKWNLDSEIIGSLS